MRLSWGHGIFGVVILIVVGFSIVLIMSFGKKHELVTSDYYQQEVDFQSQLDKQNNRIKHQKKIDYQITDDFIIVSMSADDVGKTSGAITFLRPSNQQLDFSESLQLDQEGRHFIQKSKLKKGMYNFSVDWSVGEEEYFFKENISIW